MKITLSNGYEIDNLELNGNNFISTTALSEDLFMGNLSPVLIHDGDNIETHDHMELVQLKKYSGEYWFVLRDITQEELDKIKLQSDIGYIAMMAGVYL